MMKGLYLVHENADRIKCAFYTVVVLNASLAAKYPGGIKAFVERHMLRCNNDLSVSCHMGDDCDEVVEDLLKHGLVRDRDFVFFDAARMLLGAEMMGIDQDTGFETPWLVVECTKDGVYVRFRNK
jgi:hypothetical protein